jgi:1-acyl-sn-glycerol-3-phosphate acyltransferase
MTGAPKPGRRRPPPGRLAPQAIADAQGGAREGLEWLGRVPESRASLRYRGLRLLARFVIFGLLRFRIRRSGQDRVPAGGYLLVAAAHRGWMDPFVVMHALPVEPRAWFLGSAPSTFTSRSRERFVHAIGGLLPVWRGGVRIDQHVESAGAVVGNGGVFVQMPEGTVSGPAGTTGPFRIGWAVIALRTGAPVVPLAMAGTEELYLGRRMASEVLPATSVRALVPAWDGVVPGAGSREELELAREATAALEALLRPAVERLHVETIDPPGRRRLLRDRLTWLLLRPGRLDRS